MCVRMTITVISRIRTQCSTMTPGESIIPTDTKKIAPNRFFIGSTILSICSLSTVSARMDPITKAPRAEEKPTAVAKATIRKHRPMLTIRSISSLKYLLAFLRIVGIRNIPTRNHRRRKKTSLAMFSTSSFPAKLCETAMVESSTMRRIAMRSSTTRVPNTIPA